MKVPFAVSTTASVPGATGGSFRAEGLAGFGAGFPAGACARADATGAASARVREMATRLLLMSNLLASRAW